MNRRGFICAISAAAAAIAMPSAMSSAAEERAVLMDVVDGLPRNVVVNCGRATIEVPVNAEVEQIAPHTWEVRAMNSTVGTVTFSEGDDDE